MLQPKIKVEGKEYDVLQIKWLQAEPTPHYFPWEGESVYIEYGSNYKLDGQIYIPVNKFYDYVTIN